MQHVQTFLLSFVINTRIVFARKNCKICQKSFVKYRLYHFSNSIEVNIVLICINKLILIFYNMRVCIFCVLFSTDNSARWYISPVSIIFTERDKWKRPSLSYATPLANKVPVHQNVNSWFFNFCVISIDK